MSSSPTTEPKNPLNRNVLLLAWADLIAHDKSASRLKLLFIRRRRWVLILILASSLMAVAISFVTVDSVRLSFALMSIIFPIIGTFVMTDVRRFIGTTAWIKYRYVAERIRQHIFLYRASAGEYAVHLGEQKAGSKDADDLFADNLNAARELLGKSDIIPTNSKVLTDYKQIEAAIRAFHSGSSPRSASFFGFLLNVFRRRKASSDDAANPDHDDGLSEIDINSYLKWRLNHQFSWYEKNSNFDFAQFRGFVRAAQISLLVGSILSALTGAVDVQLVLLVTATNALAAFFTTWSDVAMYGKTYSIYQIAMSKLTSEKQHWEAVQNNPDHKANIPLAEAQFIERVENILQWERDEWYEQALQAQAQSEQEIIGQLERLRARADKAQNADSKVGGATPPPAA